LFLLTSNIDNYSLLLFIIKNKKCIFVKKNMKKILVLFTFIVVLSILSSCSMYKEPCDGVAGVTKTVEDRI